MQRGAHQGGRAAPISPPANHRSDRVREFAGREGVDSEVAPGGLWPDEIARDGLANLDQHGARKRVVYAQDDFVIPFASARLGDFAKKLDRRLSLCQNEVDDNSDQQQPPADQDQESHMHERNRDDPQHQPGKGPIQQGSIGRQVHMNSLNAAP